MAIVKQMTANDTDLLIAAAVDGYDDNNDVFDSAFSYINVTNISSIRNDSCATTHVTESIIGWIVPPIYVLITLVGVIGNGLVVAVILQHKHMFNSTNVLIMGLALADLLFLVMCIPFTAIDYAMSSFPFPEWWCNAQNYLQHLTAYVTVWTLVLMAFDRFLAVVFPIESLTLRSAKNTICALMTLWLLVGGAMLFEVFDYEVVRYQWCGENRTQCVYSYKLSNNTVRMKLYYFSFNAFGYFIPLVLSCALYAKMLHRFWLTGKAAVIASHNKLNNARTVSVDTHNTSLQAACSFRRSTNPPAMNDTVTAKLSLPRFSFDANTDSHGLSAGDLSRKPSSVNEVRHRRQQKAKRRVTRMVLGVIATFAFCWLPFNICFFLHGYYDGRLPTALRLPLLFIQIVSQVLAYTNSCLNPMLYAFLSENYRHGFIVIVQRGLCCCCPRIFSETDRSKKQFAVDVCTTHKPSAQTTQIIELTNTRTSVDRQCKRDEARLPLLRDQSPRLVAHLSVKSIGTPKHDEHSNGRLSSLTEADKRMCFDTNEEILDTVSIYVDACEYAVDATTTPTV